MWLIPIHCGNGKSAAVSLFAVVAGKEFQMRFMIISLNPSMELKLLSNHCHHILESKISICRRSHNDNSNDTSSKINFQLEGKILGEFPTVKLITDSLKYFASSFLFLFLYTVKSSSTWAPYLDKSNNKLLNGCY